MGLNRANETLAFIRGAIGDPDALKDKPDFEELIHSDEES